MRSRPSGPLARRRSREDSSRLVAIVALTTAVFVLACSANTIPMITNVSVETVGDSPLGIVDPVGNAWEWCNDKDLCPLYRTETIGLRCFR